MEREQPQRDPRLSQWLSVVDYYWQRLGVPTTERERLGDELRRDVQASLAEGASVEELIAVDPAQFASDIAEANEVPTAALRPDHALTTSSYVATALVGAVLGGLVALAVWYPPGERIMDQLSYQEQGLVALVLHCGAACFATAGAMVAVHWRFRFQRHLRLAVVLTGGFLLLAGVASIFPTMALAASTGYSTQTPIVIDEVGLVLLFCTAGLLLARWIFGRVDRRPDPA